MLHIYVSVCVFLFIKFLSLPHDFCTNVAVHLSLVSCVFCFRFFHPFAIVFSLFFHVTFYNYTHKNIHTQTLRDIHFCMHWLASYVYVCRKLDSVKWTTFANVLCFNHCYTYTQNTKLCSFGFNSYSILWTNSHK